MAEAEAKLALRSLLSSAHSRPAETADDVCPSCSIFHSSVRSEVDEALKASLARRQKRLENKISQFVQSGSPSAGATVESIVLDDDEKAITNGHSKPLSIGTSDGEAQTSLTGETVPPDKLANAFEKAMVQAMKAARLPPKKFAKSKAAATNKQVFSAEEPCEKDEKKERESLTIKASLDAVNSSLKNRERQIASLTRQLAFCKSVSEKEEAKVNEVSTILQSGRNPSVSAVALYSDQLQRRKEKLKQLRLDVERTRSERMRNEELAKQQHSYLMQTELLYRQGMHNRIQRFPSGDVFLAHQPLPVDDDGAAETSDVGTAYANPYEVDSWPFEPNVLARRASQETSMDTLNEETDWDLKDANTSPPSRKSPMSQLPTLPISHLSRADDDNDEEEIGSDDDDDEEDDYGGPSTTARSV